jgi:PAS domain S-box-containing protein
MDEDGLQQQAEDVRPRGEGPGPVAVEATGVLLTDPFGVVREANHAACRLLNVAPEYLIGKPLLNFVTLEDRRAVRRRLLTLDRRRTPVGNSADRAAEFVRVQPRPPARPFEASLQMTALREPSGDELRAVRWTLRALSDSGSDVDRYAVLVDALEDYAVLSLNAEGRITGWNHGAELIFRLTEALALGSDGDALFTPEDRTAGKPQKERAEALANGRAVDERWHLRADGSRFFASGVLVPVTPGSDRRGFIKILRDITARKELEDALRDARDTLEARVAARTAELAATNEELRRQIDERLRAEEARRELTRRLVVAQEEERRRISRELHDQTGQHLTAFALSLRALEDAYPPDDGARPLLSRLRAVADELARDLHRMAVDLRPTSLDDLGLVASLAAYVEAWAERSGVRADFHATGFDAGRLPGAAETALYRIVQEALNNTAKHGAAKRVSVLLTRLPDGAARLIVEDDGSGFDADRATASSDEIPVGGRRLGLLGMKERAILLGGTLTVESAPGEGTTVYVRLPAQDRGDAGPATGAG